MTYDKINIMLPTYKRPKHLARFMRTAYEHAADPESLRFTLCVNVRDTETRTEFEKSVKRPEHFCIVDESTRQPHLAKYFNLMYEQTEFQEPGTLVSMLGDDMCFITNGWDAEILKSVNDHDGDSITFCDDAYIAHGSCCVNMFTTRKVVEATGRPFMCPKFHADMIDVVWTEVGRAASILHYLGHVKIWHDHQYQKPASQWDETMSRLEPVRKAANAQENHIYARQYATVSAWKLIRAGIGKWNVV